MFQKIVFAFVPVVLWGALAAQLTGPINQAQAAPHDEQAVCELMGRWKSASCRAPGRASTPTYRTGRIMTHCPRPDAATCCRTRWQDSQFRKQKSKLLISYGRPILPP